MSKKSWRSDIPDGWTFHMVYDIGGDGSAVFKGPNGERKRVRASATLGWDPKNEAFGAAALRRLFEVYPHLKKEKDNANT